jgi:hypothetical protein
LLAEAEVCQLVDAVVDQDILCLEVAVNDTLPVHFLRGKGGTAMPLMS